jgi:Na+-translocating ferredoxin:NAD+ oxidoreductase RnfG subunit
MTLEIRWLAPAAIIAVAATPGIAAQYMSVEQARALIFAQAQEFIAAPVALTAEQVQRVEQRSGVKVRSPNQQVWKVQSGGKLLGWFIIDQVIGKHELITYAVGINADGSLRQFQIIEYKETWGSQVRDLRWRDQFVGKTIADPLEVGADIGNLSGGTMSASHVTDGIKRLLFLHDIVLR